MERNIELARKLFEEKKYEEVVDLCVELKESEENSKEVCKLLSKAFLFDIPTPADEKGINILLNLLEETVSYMDTADEVRTFEHELLGLCEEWHRKTLLGQLEYLKKNPTFEVAGEYHNTLPEYIALVIQIVSITRGCDVVKKYCDEKGIPAHEFFESNIKGYISNAEVHRYEIDAACAIFERAKKIHRQEAEASAQYLADKLYELCEPFVVSEIMVGFACSDEEVAQEEKSRYLKQRAAILDYFLKAMVYPNGRPVSLYSSGRQEEVQKLSDIYDSIKAIEPSFVIPELPSVAGSQFPSTTSANTTTGGCYVATAVYGSYDCPQVWTLRRYRDYALAETWYGRAFIKAYYALSPMLVKWFGKTAWFKKLWQGKLDRMVEKLQAKGFDATPYEDRNW